MNTHISPHEFPRKPLLTGDPVFDEAPKNQAILDDEELRFFMDERGVGAEDQQVVAALAAVSPSQVVATYHNFFNPYLETEDSDGATAAIQRQLELNQQKLAEAQASGNNRQVDVFKQRTLLHRGMLRLTSTYGPSTALGVAITLEQQ